MNKITEKTAAESLKDAAYLLITQKETVNGSSVESLRRARRDLIEETLVEPRYLALYNAIYGIDGVPLIPRPCTISGSGVWAMPTSYHVCFPCNAGDKVVITAGGTSSYYSFLTSDVFVQGEAPSFATDVTGRIKVESATSTGEITAPEGTKFLYIAYLSQDGTVLFYPSIITINGVNCTQNVALWRKQIEKILLGLCGSVDITTDIVSDWKEGGINSTTGAIGSTSYTIVTEQYYMIDPDGELSFVGTKEDYNVHYAYFYDAAGNIITRSSTIPYTIPSNARYVRFTYGFLSASGRTIDSEGGVSAVAENWGINYISPAEKKNRLIDDLMAQNGIVPYWVNGGIVMTAANAVQENSVVTLNGYNNSNVIRLALSGALAIGVTNAIITGTNSTILLKRGRTYKVKIEALSGTVETAEGGTYQIRAGLYTGTDTTSAMTTMATLDSSNDIDWQTFSPNADGYYKMAMLINPKNTFTNYKVRVVLTDITEWVSA